MFRRQAPILMAAIFAASLALWATGGDGEARGFGMRGLPMLSYPAQVLRVLDGDTIEVEVTVWPGHVVRTRVRIGEIDAPELRARCDHERKRAIEARAALAAMVAGGEVVLVGVRPDKYYGRVVADLAVGDRDIGAGLIAAGHAVRYGSRPDWCAGQAAQRPQTSASR